MARRGGKDPEREQLLRSRRKLEEALAETRWGLEKSVGWKASSKGSSLLLLAAAAGFVVGQAIWRSRKPRGRDR